MLVVNTSNMHATGNHKKDASMKKTAVGRGTDYLPVRHLAWHHTAADVAASMQTAVAAVNIKQQFSSSESTAVDHIILHWLLTG